MESDNERGAEENSESMESCAQRGAEDAGETRRETVSVVLLIDVVSCGSRGSHGSRHLRFRSSTPWSNSQRGTSLDEQESPSAPKKRSLADVLMRATLLSQQKTQDERSESQHVRCES